MQNLDKLKGEERTRLIVCVGRCAAANFAYRSGLNAGRYKCPAMHIAQLDMMIGFIRQLGLA